MTSLIDHFSATYAPSTPLPPYLTPITPAYSQTSPSSATKREWPQPVRDYVSRAFMAENSIPDIDMTLVAARLKQVITEAAERDIMDSIDWPNLPLPQEILQFLKFAGPEAANMMNMQICGILLDAKLVSRKRKSPDPITIPPWLQKPTKDLAERIDGRSGKKQKKVAEFRATAGVSKFNDLEKRKKRFDLSDNSSPSSYYNNYHNNDVIMSDIDQGPIVGTCQILEKQYFRLTAPPKAETVRPLEVLKKTIELLVKKWKEEHNYTYICDQFKSMRQDLTVQHVKNEFTVRVYEAHARIALEKGDLGEYNQCQSQLRGLYRLQLGGRPGEFTAYRILYLIHTCNRTGMNDILADLTFADKQHAAIKHALEVRSAVASGNFHKLFRLYEDPPNMGGYLMDMFIDRERLVALSIICRS